MDRRDIYRSITDEEAWKNMTKAQQQRFYARKREAELFWTEAVAMREKGLNVQAALLEHDAKRYDVLASDVYRTVKMKMVIQRLATTAGN